MNRRELLSGTSATASSADQTSADGPGKGRDTGVSILSFDVNIGLPGSPWSAENRRRVIVWTGPVAAWEAFAAEHEKHSYWEVQFMGDNASVMAVNISPHRKGETGQVVGPDDRVLDVLTRLRLRVVSVLDADPAIEYYDVVRGGDGRAKICASVRGIETDGVVTIAFKDGDDRDMD